MIINPKRQLKWACKCPCAVLKKLSRWVQLKTELGRKAPDSVACRSPCPVWIRASLCLRVQGRTMLWGEHSAAIVSVWVTLDPSAGTDATAAGFTRLDGGEGGEVMSCPEVMTFWMITDTWKCLKFFILLLPVFGSFPFRLLYLCHLTPCNVRHRGI